MIDFTSILQPIECCPHIILVLGKGGVGKTTVSIMIARNLSRVGKTLLLSMDPARHLTKYLGVSGDEPREVLPNLFVQQISIEKEVEKITSRYSELIKELMPSLAVYNIENVADVVRYSPGVEEEVFLRLLQQVYKSNYSYVVVDTPPTGVTLRTLILPALYIAWLDRLIEIREKIVSLRYTIARALGRKVELKDKALDRLYEMRRDFGELQKLLSTHSRTSFVIVATPEPLPLFELRESFKFLETRIGNKPKLLVLNRVLPDDVAEKLGVLEFQRKSLEEIASYGVRHIVIEHLGRPTESLKDVEELEGKVRIH